MGLQSLNRKPAEPDSFKTATLNDHNEENILPLIVAA